jgi:hypothetical protein
MQRMTLNRKSSEARLLVAERVGGGVNDDVGNVGIVANINTC